MSSILLGLGFSALKKALSYASNSAAVGNTVKKTWSTRKHPAKTFDDYSIDRNEDDYEMPVSLTNYCVCRTKVDNRQFSVITVITRDRHEYAIRHLIADDRAADFERVLTAVDNPIWQSESWVFKPGDFFAPVRKFDTSFSTSYHPDLDTRSDIHCFTVCGHAFSLILTRSVLDVHIGVCAGDMRCKIGKITKLGPATKSGFVKLSASIDPWWTMPRPKSPVISESPPKKNAQKEPGVGYFPICL